MFGVEDGFDIVIANPPYIQLQKSLDDETNSKFADLYKNESFETFKRTGDIYCLFYEKGINILKKSGHLIFITSNKWMRAGYGDVLRGFFLKHNPKKLLDFGGFKVFESAAVDTNIIAIENVKNQNKMQSVHFKNDFKKGDSVSNYFNENKVMLENLSSDTWFIGTKAEIALKQKIEKNGIPLKDWDVKINYGVKTGYNRAFIIDEFKRAELIAQDPKSAEIIKPILRGRDIKRYGYNFAGLYLLFIPWHFPLHKDSSISGASKRAEIEFEKQYPYIYNHLLKYKEKLSMRNKSETGICYEWYALQRCANTYYSEFAREKVVWAETDQQVSTCIAKPNMFLQKTCFMIVGKNLKYISAILNSKITDYFMRTESCKLGDRGLSLTKDSMIRNPIPYINAGNRHLANEIKSLVDQILIDKKLGKDTKELEDKIDLMVYKLYELTYDEVKIVDPDFLMSEEEYEN